MAGCRGGTGRLLVRTEAVRGLSSHPRRLPTRLRVAGKGDTLSLEVIPRSRPRFPVVIDAFLGLGATYGIVPVGYGGESV